MNLCLNCGKPHEAEAEKCEGCGRFLSAETKKKQVNVRMYPEQKAEAVEKFGSVQNLIDATVPPTKKKWLWRHRNGKNE